MSFPEFDLLEEIANTIQQPTQPSDDIDWDGLSVWLSSDSPHLSANNNVVKGPGQPPSREMLEQHIQGSIQNTSVQIKNLVIKVLFDISQDSNQRDALRKYKGHWVLPISQELFFDILNVISTQMKQLS